MKKGNCDVCDKDKPDIQRIWIFGIETYACGECSGEIIADKRKDKNVDTKD